MTSLLRDTLPARFTRLSRKPDYIKRPGYDHV
jgi:hypothetical protein